MEQCSPDLQTGAFDRLATSLKNWTEFRQFLSTADFRHNLSFATMVECQGFEPRMSGDAGFTVQCSHLCCSHSRCMVPRTRFERATPGFVGQCSDPVELTRERKVVGDVADAERFERSCRRTRPSVFETVSTGRSASLPVKMVPRAEIESATLALSTRRSTA